MAFCRDEARGFAMTISHRLACSVVRHGWCWTPIFSESSLSVRQKPLFRETVKPGYGNQPARVQGEKGIGWAWRLGCNAGKWGCWGGTGSSSQVLECVLVGDAFLIFFTFFATTKTYCFSRASCSGKKYFPVAVWHQDEKQYQHIITICIILIWLLFSKYSERYRSCVIFIAVSAIDVSIWPMWWTWKSVSSFGSFCVVEDYKYIAYLNYN